MKKVKLTALAAVFVFASSGSYAGDNWLSIGSAPSADGGGTSMAFGFKGDGSWGFELGLVFNAQYGNKDVLDYPVPHNNYTDLGTQRTQNALGGDILYFFSDAQSGLRPYAGAGIYYSQRKHIAQSNATGWYYNQGNQSSVYATGELGVQYATQNGLLLGLAYHSARGANLSIGKKF